MWGTQWRSWLRHCATSWKVVGLIRDGVIGIFPLTILLAALWPSNRSEYQDILACKGGRYVGLTTLPPSCADCFFKSGSLSLLKPSEPVQACYGIALPFTKFL